MVWSGCCVDEEVLLGAGNLEDVDGLRTGVVKRRVEHEGGGGLGE